MMIVVVGPLDVRLLHDQPMHFLAVLEAMFEITDDMLSSKIVGWIDGMLRFKLEAGKSVGLARINAHLVVWK